MSVPEIKPVTKNGDVNLYDIHGILTYVDRNSVFTTKCLAELQDRILNMFRESSNNGTYIPLRANSPNGPMILYPEPILNQIIDYIKKELSC